MKTDIQTLIDNVREWGIQKGITGPNGKGTLLGQLDKTQEELNETRDAAAVMAFDGEYDILSSRAFDAVEAKFIDGIGDQAVTLILAAERAGVRFEECLEAAYDEIKGRTGKMVNGQFLKDSPAPAPSPA